MMANKLRWFAFRQNNIGGVVIETDKLGRWVLIEAKMPGIAMQKLDELGATDDYCECCGSRWSPFDLDIAAAPLIHGHDWRLEPGSVRVHHFDGRVESKD